MISCVTLMWKILFALIVKELVQEINDTATDAAKIDFGTDRSQTLESPIYAIRCKLGIGVPHIPGPISGLGPGLSRLPGKPELQLRCSAGARTDAPALIVFCCLGPDPGFCAATVFLPDIAVVILAQTNGSNGAFHVADISGLRDDLPIGSNRR